MSHVELEWQLSPRQRVTTWGAEQLARSRRVVRMDPRSCGLSDRDVAARSTPVSAT
jgi:hypothetical protein